MVHKPDQNILGVFNSYSNKEFFFQQRHSLRLIRAINLLKLHTNNSFPTITCLQYWTIMYFLKNRK